MNKNKAIILFLVKFFATYFILFASYSFYLNQTQVKEPSFVCSPLTRTISEHVNEMSKMLGYRTEIYQNDYEMSIRYLIDGDYVIRLVEGCTAVSVIILFISFIVAFSGSLKHTLLFGLFGVVLIYLVNILRIIALGVLYHKFPEYKTVLHDLLFPSIIYGLTFILWVTWVKYFSKMNRL